jgi:HSP20 family molecular chaperone IbpA
VRIQDPRNWMWAQALEMLDQAERLQRHFFAPGQTGTGTGVPSWQPPVDIIETDREYWILVALPGVSPRDMHVSIDGGALVVQGERSMPAKAFAGAIRRLEIPYGRFERRIAIAAGRFELREQTFDNGCLVIGLRRLA